MSTKHLPMEEGKLLELARRLPTPFYLYDEKAILENAEAFRREFSWAPSFRDYFAVKALPNPAIVKLLAEKEGFGCDCSSLPELYIAEASGVKGRGIMLTSNDTPVDEFAKALELGAVINLDDISHIDFLPSLPEMVSFRYNPGPERTGNAIIGNPVEAKYGVPKDKIVECYRIMKEKGVRHFALHTMVASNELDAQYIVETARMLFSLVGKIHDEAGVRIELIDLGGGVGIPYRPEQERIDIHYISTEIHKLYEEMVVKKHLDPLGISAQAKHVEATALNDYLVDIPLADFYEYDVLLATHMDGVLLQPTDKGPLWIVYPRDKHRKLQDIRYDYRWVWQLKHLHIR